MLHIQDSPYIKSIHYDYAKDFIKAISYNGKLYKLFHDQFIFRGHSTDKYELIPSALREYLAFDNVKSTDFASEEEKVIFTYLAPTEQAQIQKELKLLHDFFNTCDKRGLYVPHIESLRNSFLIGVDVETLFLEGKWIPKEYWELAALAQHHRVKTRLLDWTHDIFVSLYFASAGVYNDLKEKLDMAKYIRAFIEKEDTFPKHNMEIWALDTNVVMVKPIKMPFHIIQPRYHNNDNLCAQKGIFTFWESIKPGIYGKDGKIDVESQTDRRPLDIQLDSYLREIKAPKKHYLYQITIPQDAAREIYSFIEKMGYNASTLFPGYDGVARYMNEHSMIS